MGLTKLKKIGKYDVIEVIGHGGMGVVFKATDPYLGRTVAIKMMTSGFEGGESDLLKRFYREAQSTANLHHPNIVTVYDLGDHEGNPYLVMEFLEGESLDAIISAHREQSLADKINYVIQVCQGLAYAHERQIVHRDIKPANIMVLRNGGVKLVDFGIARMGTDHLTRPGQMMGSVHYMSPEQINGRGLDARTDIFSAGIVLYQALTYTLPFQGKDTISTLMKIINEQPPPLSDFLSSYPPQLEEIVSRALAKSEDDRYQTADEFAFDLMQVQGELRRELLSRQVEEAVASMQTGELRKAREQLLHVLRIEPQHTHANELLREVYQKLQKQQRSDMARQLRHRAEEALAKKNLDEALRLAEQAVAIDTDPALVTLRDSVARAKEQADRLRDLLRSAETARNLGDLDAGLKSAEEALALDASNDRALSLQEQLREEIAEREKQRRIDRLISDARTHISVREYTGALEVLHQLEGLAPDAPVLRQLIGLATAGREQERRRKELDRLATEIQESLNSGDHDDSLAKCSDALRQFPNDSRLLRLQELAEHQKEQAERRRRIDEHIESARKLLDSNRADDALTELQGARERYPKDAGLTSLLGVARDTVARQQLERRKLEIERAAREALRRRNYDEAIAKLEAGRDELGNADFDELLQLARDEAAAEARETKIKVICADAQRKIQAQQFDSALQLLTSHESELNDERLRQLITQAQTEKIEFEERLRREEEARIAAEQERLRREEEARIAAEQERQRLEAEKRAAEERARREAQARAAAERERQKIREQAARIAAEKERQRKEQEARIAAEQERQRREEQERIAADKERHRREEEKRLAEEKKRRESEERAARVRAQELEEQERRRAESSTTAVITPIPIRPSPDVRPQALSSSPKPAVAVPDTIVPEQTPQPVLVPTPHVQPKTTNRTPFVVGGLLLVLIASFVAWAVYRSLSREQLVRQAIITNPEGAKVQWDNGSGECITPNCLISLRPGQHSIKIERDGYASLERTIDVHQGSQPLVVPLAPLAASTPPQPASDTRAILDIDTGVAGASVFVDSNLVGQSDGSGKLRTNVEPGTYTIRAEKDNSGSTTKKLSVREKQQRAVKLPLKEGLAPSTSQASTATAASTQHPPTSPSAPPKSDQGQPAAATSSPAPVQTASNTPPAPAGAAAAGTASLPQPPPAPNPEQEWAQLRQSNDVTRLREFRSKFPNSAFAGEADKRIDELEWSRVKDSNSTEQLQAFMGTHPNSTHTEDVRRRLNELKAPKDVGGPDADMKSIQQVLDTYRTAYERKDANLLAQVWPTIQKKQLRDMQDFFRNAQDVQVKLTPNGKADVQGDTAALKCAFSLRFSMDGKQQEPLEKNITMRLRKANGAWVVDSVR